MEQSNFKEILKQCCVELYDVPDSATPETLLASCFSEDGKVAHFVPGTPDSPQSTWLILLQNPALVTRILQKSQSYPLFYDGKQVLVKPCGMSCEIPQQWEQFVPEVCTQPISPDVTNIGESQEFKQEVSAHGLPGPQEFRQEAEARGLPSQQYPHGGRAPYQQHSFPQQAYPGSNYPYAPQMQGHYLQGPMQYPNYQPQQIRRQFMPPNMPPQGYPYPPPWGYQQTRPQGQMFYPNMPQPPPYQMHQTNEAKGKGTTGTKGKQPKAPASECNSSEDEAVQGCKIIVTEMPANITETKLRSFFKSRKLSGGGNIESVKLQENQAIITFKKPEAVDRILQRLPLLLDKKQISVERFVSDSEDESEDDTSEEEEEDVEDRDEKSDDNDSGAGNEQKCTCTIEVRGMSDKTSRDSLEFYFESRKAGGTPLEVTKFEFLEETQVAHIQYASEEDMRKVLKRQHTIDGVRLEVQEYIPPKPRPLYDDKLLIKNVNPTTTKDGLTNFLEAKAGAIPVDIVYGEEEGVVLVSFDEAPDLDRLTKTCKTRKLDGRLLQVHRVPISNCVMVCGINSATGHDTLEFYFENKKRSGGGEIEKLDFKQEEGICFVYFTDHKVVDSVCSRKHKIDGHKLSVKMYNDVVGEVSDSENWNLKVPDAFLTKMEERKVQFLLSSKMAKEALKTALSKVYASVTWPENYSEKLKLECILTKDVEECRKLVKSWKKDTTEAVKAFFDTLVIENIHILQEAWAEMKDTTQKMTISNPDEVFVICEEKMSEIYIVGYHQQVPSVAQEIKCKVKEIEDELERKKKQVTEYLEVKHFQLLLLTEQQFGKSMEDKYNELKVSIDHKKLKIMFEGLPNEVVTAKLDMFDILNKCVTSSAGAVSDGMCKLLEDTRVKAYVSESMKTDGVSAVWNVEQGLMKVYAIKDEDVVKAAHILQNVLVESKIHVDKESLCLLSTKAWDDKVAGIKQDADLKHTAEILSYPTKDVIEVYTTDIDKGIVLEKIHAFLDENTIFESKLKLKSGVGKFLQQSEKQKQIENIAKTLIGNHVTIETSKTCTEIIIKGTAVGKSMASQQVDALIQKIMRKKHTINKPGITGLMESENGLEKLGKVERQTNVVIIPDECDDVGDEKDGEQRGEVVQELFRYNGGKYKVMIMLGDITELETDVLVNPANEKLQHGRGLAKAIVEKGGQEIQMECDEYVKKKKLRTGKIFYGKPGTLRCKMIAHAACPSWQGGDKGEEDSLSGIVIDCLEKSSNKGYTSVAIPPLGAGAFGIPIKKTARIVINAMEEYFEDDSDSNITDVCLCAVQREDVDMLAEVLKKKYPRKVHGTSNSADVQHWSSARVTKQPISERKDVTGNDFEGFDIPPESDFDGNIQIDLVKGSMAEQKVEVIVNTAGQDLQLHNGAVSKSLLQAAGQEIQEECSKLYPNGVQHGDIAVTEGYRLCCQNVFHGSLPQWDGGSEALTILQNFMTKCLQEASNRFLQSVAFPAMGTGNLGYPRDIVAKEMYRIVSQFACNNTKSTIKKVSFVVYHLDEETIKAFEEVKKSRKKTPTNPTKQTPKTGRQSRMFGSQVGRSDSIDTDQVSLDVGKFKLKIYQGDITMAIVDAIVNPSNAELNLSQGAVSNAIKNKGGAELQKQASLKSAVSNAIKNKGGAELQKQASLKKREMKKKGVAITTSGGGLPCQFVVHLNAEEHKPWKTKIEKILKAADETGTIKTIAFPALGTGVVNGPTVDDAAKYFFDALTDFQISAKSVDLQEIHIVIFQEDMTQKFLVAIQKCFKSFKGFKQKGYLQQLSDWVTGTKSGLEWNPEIERITLQPSSYPIVILGDNKYDIDRALIILDEVLENAYRKKNFQDDIIKEFTESQKKKITTIETDCHVELKVEQRLGRIQVHGLNENVMQASDKIHQLLRNAVLNKRNEEEAQLIADMVTWCFMEVTDKGQEIEEYPPEVNRILEMAYRRQENKASFKDNQGNIYWVDLDNFEEYANDNPDDIVKVIRRNKMEESASDVPKIWTEMKDTENLNVVPLQSSDQEYQNVEKEFQKTLGTQKTVTKIERIQNRTLYQQYMAKKKLMDKQNPRGTVNERSLWHGTAVDVVDSINAHGFNRSYCGKNATAFGNGVYFAVESRYSAQDQYAHVDAANKKRMYLCKVLTGEFTQGKGGLRVPPQKPNSPAHVLYDSVVDTPANPKMYIIFNDTQAYPEYLLTFDK